MSVVKCCWCNATAITAFAALLTALFVGIQTCNLNNQLKVSIKQSTLALSVTRPIVLLRAGKNAQLTQWEYSAFNYSNYPARIVAKNIKIRIGDDISNMTAPIHVIVSQGNDLSMGKTIASAKMAKHIRDGKLYVEMEGCIIYRSIIEDDPRRWEATSKDIYSVQAGAFKVKFRDTRDVSPNTEQCVANLTPENS